MTRPSVILSCAMWLIGAVALPGGEPERRFVEVETGVKVEVLDWGGTGRPLLFLHGNGCDAHIWNGYADKFTPRFHAIAMTRRGAGASDRPVSGYGDECFGRDVLAVIHALQLKSPVLIGHSMAGAEMSWINTHQREGIAGFVYLDALGSDAFYSDLTDDVAKLGLDVNQLLRDLDRMVPGSGELHPKQLAADVTIQLSRVQTELKAWLVAVKDMPEPTAEELKLAPPYMHEMYRNSQKYTALSGPILAIFAVPANAPAKAITGGEAPAPGSLAQADAVARSIPSARVVKLPGADHFVWHSNEAEVTREILTFLEKLPADSMSEASVKTGTSR